MKELTHKEMSSRGGSATKEQHPEQFKEMGRKGVAANIAKYGKNYMIDRLIKSLTNRHDRGEVSDTAYTNGVAKLEAKRLE